MGEIAVPAKLCSGSGGGDGVPSHPAVRGGPVEMLKRGTRTSLAVVSTACALNVPMLPMW